MSDFRLFNTNRKGAFLNKTKQEKAKREDNAKKSQAIIILQKNIRAFLTFRKHDSPDHPLLMSTPGPIPNQQFAHSFWSSQQQLPAVLRQRLLLGGIRALLQNQEIHLHPNLQTAILQHSSSVELKEEQYCAILSSLWNRIDSHYLSRCLAYKNFRNALKTMLGNMHDLTDFVMRIPSVPLINQVLKLYFSSDKKEPLEGQSEQRLLKSYYNVVSLLGLAIDERQECSLPIQLTSTVVQAMRQYYTQLVMHRYHIDPKFMQAQTLREEVEQSLKEKQEWEEYQSHLYHLCRMVPNILKHYIWEERRGVGHALDMLIEVTKLGDSVVSFDLSVNEFFLLLEKLTPRGDSNEQGRYPQYLIVILMVEKYLQGLNDLKFSKIFRYQTDRLKESIRGPLLRFLKGMVTLNAELQILRQISKHTIAAINNLYNKIFRTQILPSSTFEDPSINIFEGNYKYNNYGNNSYMKELLKLVEICPFLLPIDTRFLLFRNMVANDYAPHEYGSDRNIVVHRGREFEDAMAQLFNRNIKGRWFHIRFVNEYGREQTGMDAGGLTKEFLTRIFKSAFDPARKWFIQNGKKELLPNPDYWRLEEGSLAREYEFIGRLLGKSLRENIMLGVKFAGPFLNLLINNRNTFDQLLLIDPDLYRSLVYITEMEEGVQQLELTFQYHDILTKKVVNLKPGGDKLRVTGSNKMEYVNLLINYKVNRSIERQTRYLRRGLKSVINQHWIRMFNYTEFNYLISGTGKIDVSDWRKYAQTFLDGNNGAKELIDNFWSIVYEFSEEEKSLLLKFVTSCERPSFLGFKDLSPPFTIRVTRQDDSKLPVSHTCSNVLDLPAYSNKAIMREKLLYAIRSGAGFEIA